MNDKGRIAEETRNKVLEAAWSLGYKKLLQADQVIGLLYSRRLDSLSTDAFYGPVILGIEDRSRDAGYHVSIVGINPEKDESAEAEDMDAEKLAVAESADTRYRQSPADTAETSEIATLSSRFAGMIVLGADISHALIRRLRQTNKPIVLIDNELGDGSVDAVVIANEQGMRATVDYLVGLGHRDIAYVGGPRTHVSLRQRHKGFVDGMQANGLRVRDELIHQVDDFDYSILTGQIGVERLMAAGGHFTAVVCDNDDVAVGAVQELLRLGKNVPGQVSVTGFDGRPIVTRPHITTVDVPRFQIGDLAAWRLLALIEEKDSPITITTSTSIVERETTGPVNIAVGNFT